MIDLFNGLSNLKNKYQQLKTAAYTGRIFGEPMERVLPVARMFRPQHAFRRQPRLVLDQRVDAAPASRRRGLIS